MKRFHVHLGVNDLDRSIRFYSSLFGMAPTVRERDYAKWMLDDPRVNFAIPLFGGEAAAGTAACSATVAPATIATQGEVAAVNTPCCAPVKRGAAATCCS